MRISYEKLNIKSYKVFSKSVGTSTFAMSEGGTIPEYFLAKVAVNSAPKNKIMDEYETHSKIKIIDPAAP